ncbi:TPA: transglycosylase domain-containing protein [Streptococcus suis]
MTKNHDDNKKQNQPHFYDVDFDYHEDDYPNKPVNTPKEKLNAVEDNPSPRKKQVEASFNKVKALFQSAAANNHPIENPYKRLITEAPEDQAKPLLDKAKLLAKKRLAHQDATSVEIGPHQKQGQPEALKLSDQESQFGKGKQTKADEESGKPGQSQQPASIKKQEPSEHTSHTGKEIITNPQPDLGQRNPLDIEAPGPQVIKPSVNNQKSNSRRFINDKDSERAQNRATAPSPSSYPARVEPSRDQSLDQAANLKQKDEIAQGSNSRTGHEKVNAQERGQNRPSKRQIDTKAPLPSPEAIRQERERRRRQRIAELEAIQDVQEVATSHQSWQAIGRQLSDQRRLKEDQGQSLQTKSNPEKPSEATLAKDIQSKPISKTDKAKSETSKVDLSRNHAEELGETPTATGITTFSPDKTEKNQDASSIKQSSPARLGPGTPETKHQDNRPAKPSTTGDLKTKDTQAAPVKDHGADPDQNESIPAHPEQSSDAVSAQNLEEGLAPDTESSKDQMSQGLSPLTAIRDTSEPEIKADALETSESDKENQFRRPQAGTGNKATNTFKNKNKNKDIALGAATASLAVGTDPVAEAEVEAQDQQEAPRRSKKDKKKARTNKAAYALTGLSAKDRIIFALNVFFNVLKRFAIYILLIGILFAALAGGVGAGYFAYLVSQTPPPSRQEMTEQLYRVEQQSKLYYADGSQIASVRADVVRTVTELSDISPYIIDGLVATEDEYFYEHPGVVPKAILRAALQEVFSAGSGTGGSTLTQQLVKQQMLTNDVTFFRKANEILLALRVENYFSKDEILTAYLNISPFGRNNNGDNVAGILAASQGIFGKTPDQVNLAQAAFLVGLPQDPYTYTPYDQYGQIREDLSPGIDRMKEVLFRMYRTEKITKEAYEEALSYDITKDFIPTVQIAQARQTYLYQAMMNGAIEQIMRLNIQDQGLTWDQVSADVDWYNEFYFAAEEQLRTGGYNVYTTIDKDIYDTLQSSAQAYKDQLGVAYDGVYTDPDTGEETYYVENVQSGVVVMDNTTGRVLGFVSGTDYDTNQIDHAFGMRRSPGSTIKPLAVYAPAIEYNMINPSTLIPDTAFEMTYEDGSTWTPTNYGSAVSGNLMTARTALLRSDNLPAVRIYQELLNNNIKIADFLKDMGFDMVDGYTVEDTQNLAFSLGGVTTGPTVFEQTRAFTTFANNGIYNGGYYIERIEDAFGNIVYQHQPSETRVFSEDTNYLMVSMLRDTNTQGTGRTAAANMAMGGDWIAKSGISENSRDIWYIASTPSITIGTWIGYDNRYVDYYFDINDGFGRESERVQIYWANLANDLYANYPEIFGVDQTFSRPDSIVETPIVQSTGTLPGQLNINGTVVSVNQPLVNEVFKVTNPAPALTYDFIFNGTDADAQRFWGAYIQQAQEALRRQQENARNASSSSDQNNQNEQTTVQETTQAP